MSGGHAPSVELDARGLRVHIVASQWHQEVMDALVAGAVAACEKAGASCDITRVPGAFELPLGCQRVSNIAKVDAIVALGVVVRGGTPHFEYVCSAATEGIMRVMLDQGIPIGFGLLTVDTEDQARDRAGLPNSREDKGAEAVEAALSMAIAHRSPSTAVGFG